MANEQQQHASQKLPAGLAGVLNPEENRDSAYFSSTDASSKRTSSRVNRNPRPWLTPASQIPRPLQAWAFTS